MIFRQLAVVTLSALLTTAAVADESRIEKGVNAVGAGLGSIGRSLGKLLEPKSKESAKEESAAEEQEESADEQALRMKALSSDSQALLVRYWTSAASLAEAQARFAEALGAKEQAAALRWETGALMEGNYTDKDLVDAQIRTSKKTNDVINKKLKQEKELTKEQRQQFANGMLYYGIGLVETKEMNDELVAFAEKMSAELKDLGVATGGGISQTVNVLLRKVTNTDKNVAAVLYLSGKAPGLLKSHRNTASAVLEYAENNDIEAPSEIVDFI